MTASLIVPLDRTIGSVNAARQGRQVRDLERLIADLMKANVVPGVSIALINDAAVTWHRHFGVRDTASGMPVDEHTVFEAASVSKTVFAYAVMQLRDRGMLDLDVPLTTYTPDRILEGDPRLDRITARHILAHTSGLPNHRSGAEPLGIRFTPGERFEYSGEGYWYLQSVMTRLTGKVDSQECREFEDGMKVCATDIGAYLKSNLLDPCRMPDSGYVWSDAFARTKARPHDAAGKPLTMAKPSRVDTARYAAMGGLHTTALDYANYLIEIMAPRAPSRFRLTAASRAEMLRPHVKVDADKSWALGWQVRHTPQGNLVQHQGGQSGFQTFTAASDHRRTGYVILTNGDNGWKVFYNERFVALLDRILLQ